MDNEQPPVAAAIAAAVRRAEEAIENVKQALARGELEDIGAKAAAAASTLYREGQEMLANSETVTRAKSELSGAVRRNPLAAIGIAFAAGLLLALLTRS